MLKGLLRPCWPKLAIWRIVALTFCGFVLLTLSIRDLVGLQTGDMALSGVTDTLARGCTYFGFSGISLISALFACWIRRYGLLLRKLASNIET